MNIRTVEVYDADTGLHEVATQSQPPSDRNGIIEAVQPLDYVLDRQGILRWYTDYLAGDVPMLLREQAI